MDTQWGTAVPLGRCQTMAIKFIKFISGDDGIPSDMCAGTLTNNSLARNVYYGTK